jgi:hypothetical protein
MVPMAAEKRRAEGAGRKPELKPCSFCGENFGTVELRKHITRCPTKAKRNNTANLNNGVRKATFPESLQRTRVRGRTVFTPVAAEYLSVEGCERLP